MSLSEVAEFARANEFYDRRQRYAIDRLLERFEADPDFTLRQRIEALVAEWENSCGLDEGHSEAPPVDEMECPGEFARRLRECLEGK
jgi:hypothetical protein